MSSKLIIALFVGTIMTGCAGMQGHWEHSNSFPTHGLFEQDKRQCEYEAARATVNSGSRYRSSYCPRNGTTRFIR